ncbi:hypothetical protein ACFQL4_13465 [Halosimplex aquaticum]
MADQSDERDGEDGDGRADDGVDSAGTGDGSPRSAGEEAVDLSELDGLFEDEQPEFLSVEGGERRASGRVMVVAGLAVAVPLAPLSLFLVSTVRPLSVWTAPLVFLGGWLAPAAYLARARVPAEAFARSLYLIAAGTALIPVGLRIGDRGAASGDLQIAVGAVTGVALVVAGLAAALGRYMHGQADERVSGELRAFEAAQENGRRPRGEGADESAGDDSNANGAEE